MRFRRPYEADRRPVGDGSAADLGLHVKIGEALTAVPPADLPSCDEVTRRIRSELGDHFRPLYVVQHWRAPGTNGLVRVCLHVLASYMPIFIPVAKSKHEGRPAGDPRGQIVRNLLMPSAGNAGIDWRAPIFMDDVLDGLTDDERKAGALPRYEPLDMQLVDVFRRHIYEKRHREQLSKGAQAKADADSAREQDEADTKAHVQRLGYLKRHDRLNRVDVPGVGVIPPPEPTVFLNHTQGAAS